MLPRQSKQKSCRSLANCQPSSGPRSGPFNSPMQTIFGSAKTPFLTGPVVPLASQGAQNQSTHGHENAQEHHRPAQWRKEALTCFHLAREMWRSMHARGSLWRKMLQIDAFRDHQTCFKMMGLFEPFQGALVPTSRKLPISSEGPKRASRGRIVGLRRHPSDRSEAGMGWQKGRRKYQATQSTNQPPPCQILLLAPAKPLFHSTAGWFPFEKA